MPSNHLQQKCAENDEPNTISPSSNPSMQFNNIERQLSNAHSSPQEMELQFKNFINSNTLEQWTGVEEIDGVHHLTASLSYCDIISTAFSIIMRAIAVFVNIRLAFDYYLLEQYDNFILTAICIVVPMTITMLIYANMCHQDGKFNAGICQSLHTLFVVFLSSYMFRYWTSFVYSVKCKCAERKHDKETQWKYFKLTVREESDVAFIRLFECFLEAAPQKILQISIVLGHIDKITTVQTVAICSYFGSMAWCLSVYHRCNRFAQIDKHNIKFPGLVLQLCWHFCIAVSRTLCIAYVASIFPLWCLLACLVHAFVLGSLTYFVDRPKFAKSAFFNYLFCLVLGVVYLFTYVAVKDAPTRRKYILYYILCFSENIVCISIFVIYASSNLAALALLFYPLCAMTLAFYPIGIVFMIIYYLYYHPKITARKSKRIMNNN